MITTEAMEEYISGTPKAQIAAKYNLTVQALDALAKKEGLNFGQKIKNKIFDLYKAGNDTSRIARELELTIPEVVFGLRYNLPKDQWTYLMLDADDSVDPWVNPDVDITQQICDRYKAGNTVREISRALCVPMNEVENQLTKANLLGSPDVERERLCNLQKRGMSVCEISKRCGLNIATVKATLSDTKTERKLLDVGAMKALYEEGATLKELADQYGVSIGTVRDRLAKAGTSIRPRYNQSGAELDTDEILVLYADGLTLTEIAKKAGTSVKTVCSRVKEHASEMAAFKTDHVRARYAKGASIKGIAKSAKMSVKDVLKIVGLEAKTDVPVQADPVSAAADKTACSGTLEVFPVAEKEEIIVADVLDRESLVREYIAMSQKLGVKPSPIELAGKSISAEEFLRYAGKLRQLVQSAEADGIKIVAVA